MWDLIVSVPDHCLSFYFGESRHPCRTPTVVLNNSLVLPLNRTAFWALSYRFSMAHMMLALMLYFLIIALKASCYTLSKAFLNKNHSLRAMKTFIRKNMGHTT